MPVATRQSNQPPTPDRRCAQTGRSPARLSKAATNVLLGNPWLGNVRQSKNVVLRSATLSEAPVIDAADLELAQVDVASVGVRAEQVGSLEEAVTGLEKSLLQQLYPQYPSTRKLAYRLRTSHSAIATRLRKYRIGD